MVPSFSSRGFGFKKKVKKTHPDISEVMDALDFSKEFLTECMLVSAYDIFHKHISFKEEHMCTDVTLLDSGGYESGETYDISTTSKYNYAVKEWNKESLISILDTWPEYKAAIIVSFDHGNHRICLSEQIKSALELFGKYPNMLYDFLVKPETKEQEYIQVNNVISQVNAFKEFHIIGVTEKELGNSILVRMQNIYKIRSALDNSNISAPIHVFGSLDPVTSILYFLAGAEIFDGLTWLKYSYMNNSAIYTSNFGVLDPELGINVRDGQVKMAAITKNTYYLDKMKYTMRDFLIKQDFSLFDKLGGPGFGDIIKNCYTRFESNLK
jgi:hypothetical protein